MNHCGGRVPRHKASGEPEGQKAQKLVIKAFCLLLMVALFTPCCTSVLLRDFQLKKCSIVLMAGEQGDEGDEGDGGSRGRRI